MTQLKLQTKNKKYADYIIVNIKNKTIVRNKHGFVLVKRHPSNANTIHEDIVNKYYDIPDGIDL